MNSQTRREIRFGLIALALSGLLLTLNVVLRGPIDLADPQALIRAATSPNWLPAWTIALVGVVLHLYGVFGLYRYLTYQVDNLIAFVAFVLRIAAFALSVPLVTFFAVNLPVIADLYQQGNQGVTALVEANFTSGLGLVLLGVSAVAGIPGSILFGIAIWRDGRLPKWTGVVYALSILAGVPKTFLELLGVMFLMISAGVIAWKGWQESAAEAGQ
jgi:hypothetical protein